jgi:hypothetical protein
MASLTFYRQQRADGGIRTGIDADGSTLVEDFQEGDQEQDPALLWYIDLRCEGDALPTEVEPALEWSRANAEGFAEILETVADHLAAGIDSEALPYRQPFPDRLPSAGIEVAVSAMRRVAARNVAQELRHMSGHWAALLDALSSVPRV